MKSSARFLALILPVTALGCGRGHVWFDFFFEEPVPPMIYAAARVEEREELLIGQNNILGTAGPELLIDGVGELRVTDLPPGEKRVGIFEGRDYLSLSAPITYYGQSEFFETGPGIDRGIPILIQPRRPPSLSELGVAIESENNSGFVRDPNVKLILFTDRGVAARVSNDRNFLDDRTIVIPLTETATGVQAPEGFRPFTARWNLDYGRTDINPEPGVYDLDVWVKYIDENFFESVPATARVSLDTEPPMLREGTGIEPRAAGPSTRIKVNVISTELLRSAPAIAMRNAAGVVLDGFVFERLLPEEDGPSNTFTYLSSAPGAANLADGEYTILIRGMVDLAGNVQGELELDTVVLDGVAPALSELTIRPSRVGASGIVSIGFNMGEDIPLERVELTFGPNRVERCGRSGSTPPIRVECVYEVDGSEAQDDEQRSVAIRVFATDGALNSSVLQGSVFVDRLAPRLESMTFAPRYAAAGTRAVFRSITSEPTEGPPAITWMSGRDPGFVWSATASADIDHVFLLDVGASSDAGDYAIERIELTDDLGNRRVYDATNDPRFPIAFTVDNAPPRVFDLAVSPARVGLFPGSIVTLDFAVDEALPAGAPRVSLEGMDISPTCTMGQVTGTITRWSCRYVVTGMELAAPSEALFSFTVEARDLASGFGSASAPVTFDFLAPSLVSATFTPEVAGDGDLAQLEIVSSEELPAGFAPPLTWTGLAPLFMHQPNRDTAVARYYELLVSANSGGSFTLSSVQLRDTAGNEAEAALSLDWLVDPTPPELQNLTVRVCTNAQLNSCGAQLVPPRVPAIAGRVVRVDFTAVEASPGEERVYLGARDITSSCTIAGTPPARTFSCLYTTTGAEYSNREVTESATIQCVDRAGNAASESSPIIFDYAPPALTSVVFSPSPAGIGANVTLTLIGSEELDASYVSTLSWTPANRSLPFTLSSASAFQRTYQYPVTAATTSRSYSLSGVSLRDLAGNETIASSAPLPVVLPVDTIAPVIGAITADVGHAALNLPATSPPRINGAPGRTLVISAPVTEANSAPATYRVTVGSIDASSSCTNTGSGNTRTLRCSYAMTGTEPSGLRTITIRVADTAGNVTTDSSASVVFDLDPPDVIAGSPEVTLVPDAGNRLSSVTRVRDGTRVELRFEMDEELAELDAAGQPTPAVSANPGSLAFAHQPRAGNVYLFTHTLGATTPCDPATQSCGRTFTIAARDTAGNSAVIAVPALSFTIDTAAPTAAIGNIVLDRRPWGDATNPDPRMILSGAAQAAEAATTLIVSSAFDINAEIARIATAADGSFPATELFAADASTVRLEVVDGAGNVSAPMNVAQGLWLATSAGKVPGLTFPNPHDVLKSAHIQQVLDQAPPGGAELEATSVEIAAIAQSGGGTVHVTAKPSWQLYEPSTASPEAREDHGFVYDPRRGRAVLFGGVDAGGGLFNDTWEHDGDHWIPVSPPGARPSARSRPLMIYHAALECSLLVGGFDGTTYVNDVWSYDGERWTELTPNATTLPPRRNAAIGYHEALGVAVIFGGRGSTNQLSNETYFSADGVNWVLGVGNIALTPREDASMAYYSQGGVSTLVLFGGATAGGRVNDTFTWNGTGWTLMSPMTPRPSARRRPGMATFADPYDLTTSRVRVMMFGGDAATGYPYDLWSWNGSRWTQETATGSVPPGVITPLIYDARYDRFAIFGGQSDTTPDPLATGSIFNRTRWSPLTPTTLATPPASSDFGLAANSNRAILFSGTGGDAQPWMWDATGWSPLTVAGTAPAAREGHGFASFGGGSDQRFLMLGGNDLINRSTIFAETWVYEYLSGWTQYPTPPGLEGRTEHAMVRIERSGINEVLLFGGDRPFSGFGNDTWSWNGITLTWSERATTCTPAQTPEPRASAAMVYDRLNGRVVMFGGSDGPTTPMNDLWTWAWNGTCWSQIPRPLNAAWPSRRTHPMMVFDPDRARTLLLGGEAGVNEEIEDLWMLRNSATEPWLLVTPDPSLASIRSRGGAVYDVNRGRVLLFGGKSHGSGSDDTLMLSPGANQRPGLKFSVEWGAALVDRGDIQSIAITAIAGGRSYNLTSMQGGTVLRVWDPSAGRWSVLASNAASTGTPQPLTYSTQIPVNAQRLVSPASNRIDAQVTTTYVDLLDELAEVEVDYIEVQIGYGL